MYIVTYSLFFHFYLRKLVNTLLFCAYLEHLTSMLKNYKAVELNFMNVCMHLYTSCLTFVTVFMAYYVDCFGFGSLTYSSTLLRMAYYNPRNLILCRECFSVKYVSDNK